MSIFLTASEVENDTTYWIGGNMVMYKMSRGGEPVAISCTCTAGCFCCGPVWADQTITMANTAPRYQNAGDSEPNNRHERRKRHAKMRRKQKDKR